MMDNQSRGLIKGLENWAKRITKGYRDVDVNNLSSSFRDGLAFCAIIHHYRPDLIDFECLSKTDVFENNNLAFSTAEKQLGIQALLDAEDMVKLERPDRLCIITYLSQLYNYFENQNKVKTLKPGIKRIQNNSSGPAAKVTVVQPKLLSIKHEVCHVCKHRVYILERLIVDNKLYHRDCFRCSKCSALLNPGAYVESDTLGLYECAVCLLDENSYSMDTQDTSYDSSDDRNGSLSNASSKPASPIMRKDVPSKPPLSEAVNNARSNFLLGSLSPKSPEPRKLGSLLRNGISSAEDTSTQSVKDDSVDSGVSVRDKISVFESSRNSKLGSLSKAPELSNSSTLTPSSPALASDSTTPAKSPRTSAISFSSPSAKKSDEVTTKVELTESAIQSKEATSKVEFTESSTQQKSVVDGVKLRENISLSNSTFSDSKDSSETSLDSILQQNNTSESPSDKLNCDNSVSTSVLSKVPNPTFRHSLNLETLPKVESPSKLSPSKSFQKSDYKSPFKTSRDIFQTSLQPLKLGIPTASSTPKKDSLSLPQTPITSSPDSPRIGNVEIPQIRSTYSRTLPRPGSASNLLSKDNRNELNSTSGTDSSDSILLNSSGRRSSLESYNKGTSLCEDVKATSGSIKQLTEESKGSSITSLKEKSSSFQLSSTMGSSFKSENSLFKRQSNDIPVPTVRQSLEIKRLSSPKVPEPTSVKILSDKPSDTVTEKPISSSAAGSPEKSNVEAPKIEAKSVIPKVVKPKPAKPPKSDKEYPDDLNPFGDEEEEEAYPDDLNPFGDDDDGEAEVSEIKVSVDDYDDSKNPFASDDDEDNAEVVAPRSKPPTPNTAPAKSSSPFQSVWTDSPTGSLKGTMKKRKAPKPPMVTDIFPHDSQDSEAHGSFSSLKSSPSGSRISLQTPSPKLRKSKPAPPPPPVLGNKQSSQPDVIANSKQMKDADNMKLKTSTAPTDADVDAKQAKKKKRPAPPVPIPKRKDNKKIPLKEIIREMKEIEEKQKECERQGRDIEILIRDRDKDEEPTVEEEEYIMQLFDLVNQKNALFRRQAELMYIKRSQRLEEQQAEIESQIRQLLMKPDSEKTEEDRTREEELIIEMKDIVDQRSSIIDSIEMDRRRELEEDASVQEQIEIKNGDLPIAAEIKEKSSGKKKDKKAKKEKKKKDKAKKDEAGNDDSKKSSSKKKGLFK